MYEVLIRAKCENPLRYREAKAAFRGHIRKYFTVMKSIGCIFGKNESALHATAFTYLIILGESHAVLHTYPENHEVFINICSCSNKYSSAEIVSIGNIICKDMGLDVVTLDVIKRN